MRCSGSGKRRPRLARDAIAYGASVRASISSSSCLVRSIAFNNPRCYHATGGSRSAPLDIVQHGRLTREAKGFYNRVGG
jgi:hypothetical protein